MRRGSSAETTTGARSSVPSSSATPTARPSEVSTESTRAPSRISAPYASAARASTWVKPPLPPLWNAHEPEVAVVLAHLVEQQHQPGAGRHRPDLGADDARGGVEALDRLVLEVVLEPVRGAAGEQPDDVVHHLLLDATEVVEQPRHVGLVLGVLAEDVRAARCRTAAGSPGRPGRGRGGSGRRRRRRAASAAGSPGCSGRGRRRAAGSRRHQSGGTTRASSAA